VGSSRKRPRPPSPPPPPQQQEPAAWPPALAALRDADWAALAALSAEALPPSLAVCLREPTAEAGASLAATVDALGTTGALGLLRLAAETEAGGGLPTADGARRRTAGGVFFALLRDAVDAPTYKRIFAARSAAHSKAVNARRRRDAAYAAMSMGHAPSASAWRGFDRRDGGGSGGSGGRGGDGGESRGGGAGGAGGESAGGGTGGGDGV
jgi:uncharacterized membrane protein YgcG